MATYTFFAYQFDTLEGAFPANLVVEEITIDDGDDGNINPGDTLNGAAISEIYNGSPAETVTVDGITYTGVTIAAAGVLWFVPFDGQVLADGVASASDGSFGTVTSFPVTGLEISCFTAGTLVATPDGQRAIETLQVGDLVTTADNGAQPIRWIGIRTVTANGPLAPVRFAPGAIGNDRELIVSPCHRMVLGGWRAEALFDVQECLVAARDLVNGDTIHSLPGGPVTYVHIMFDRHEVVFAEGAPSESFRPSGAADSATRAEVLDIFPELADGTQPRAARPTLKPHEARLIA